MLGRKLLVAAILALGMVGAPVAAHAADTAAYDRLLTRYVAASADGINRVRYAAWVSSLKMFARSTPMWPHLNAIARRA
ncbi:MAG: hypothetical protein IPG56_20295 [Caulobacteraceae bacterium]|nr:hypothetical protein [Caulobacteraceae bacterium]